MRSLRWIAALCLLAGGALTIRSVPRVLQEYGAVPRPPDAADDAAAVIGKYGRPDSDTTTKPSGDGRPTRVLTYGDMQIIFVERDFGSARVWKLLGFLDVKTRIALSGDDALKRLTERRSSSP